MLVLQNQSLTEVLPSHPAKNEHDKTSHSYYKDVQFSTLVPKQFYCSICQNILKQPIQTPCGHRACSECVSSFQRTKDEPVCPVDKEPIDMSALFLDRYCEREILNLQCYCLFSKNGCLWKGPLCELENHSKDCPYLEKHCTNPGCQELVTKQNIDEHLRNSCNYRLTPCDHCKEMFPLAEQKIHSQRCPKVVTPCTSECGVEVPLDQLEDHLKKCPLSEHNCSFASHGCEFKGTRRDQKQHEKEAIEEHLALVNTNNKENDRRANKQEDEIKNLISVFCDLETKMENQNEVLANTRQDLRTQQIKLGIVEKTVSEQKKELATIRQKLENCNGYTSFQNTPVTSQLEECMNFLRASDERLSSLERQVNQLKAGHLQQHESRSQSPLTSNHNLEQRLAKTEHLLAVQDIQLSEHDLMIQMLDTTSYDGQFIWKIDNWNKRYHDAVSGKTMSAYSPPFYVGRFGYKVCGRLYPNGDGMGKGNHVSLFFVVMKSDYDALLRWPFKQKVSFQLFDQDNQMDVADAFRPDPNSSSFKRPTTNMNIASGCPLFISHTDLYQRGYIRDDTMFIKITVDMTGIPAL